MFSQCETIEGLRKFVVSRVEQTSIIVCTTALVNEKRQRFCEICYKTLPTDGFVSALLLYELKITNHFLK